MELFVTDPVFAWARLEDNLQLATLRDLVTSLPDADLLQGLRQARGKGRDDYPVEHLWGVVVFTVALRHLTPVACAACAQATQAAEGPAWPSCTATPHCIACWASPTL